MRSMISTLAVTRTLYQPILSDREVLCSIASPPRRLQIKDCRLSQRLFAQSSFSGCVLGALREESEDSVPPVPRMCVVSHDCIKLIECDSPLSAVGAILSIQ